MVVKGSHGSERAHAGKRTVKVKGPTDENLKHDGSQKKFIPCSSLPNQCTFKIMAPRLNVVHWCRPTSADP